MTKKTRKAGRPPKKETKSVEEHVKQNKDHKKQSLASKVKAVKQQSRLIIKKQKASTAPQSVQKKRSPPPS